MQLIVWASQAFVSVQSCISVHCHLYAGFIRILECPGMSWKFKIWLPGPGLSLNFVNCPGNLTDVLEISPHVLEIYWNQDFCWSRDPWNVQDVIYYGDGVMQAMSTINTMLKWANFGRNHDNKVICSYDGAWYIERSGTIFSTVSQILRKCLTWLHLINSNLGKEEHQLINKFYGDSTFQLFIYWHLVAKFHNGLKEQLQIWYGNPSW